MTSLFLIFNHTLTPEQEADAHTSLGVGAIVNLPPHLKELWGAIPPDADSIASVTQPVTDWLAANASPGDYVLVQGDFGAVRLVVQWAFEHELVPVYSTTQRIAHEEPQPDGSIRTFHTFQHRIFRKYGV